MYMYLTWMDQITSSIGRYTAAGHSMQIGPSRACFRMVIFSTQNVVKTGISVIIIELRKVDMLNGK